LSTFSLSVRVYYEDTDSGGVVYHANYLKFMERARTEYLRAMGFEQDHLRNQQAILFAVHSLQLEYRQPAVFNELLNVTANLSDVGRASLSFSHQVQRSSDAAVLCAGEVRVACVDTGSFRPVPIPEKIRMELVHAR
jgi:acyl-CoA thioester hydrolase